VEEVPESIRDLRVGLSVHPMEYGESVVFIARPFESLEKALEVWQKAGQEARLAWRPAGQGEAPGYFWPRGKSGRRELPAAELPDFLRELLASGAARGEVWRREDEDKVVVEWDEEAAT